MSDRTDSVVLAAQELVAVPGGWMAVSTSESRLHVGVIGETKDEATCLFAEALRAWEQLLGSTD